MSALLLVAASPVATAAAPARDSQGQPIRRADGACISASAGQASTPSEGCAQERKRNTFRVLQNIVPQPSVSYVQVDLPPEPESVHFQPSAGFTPGHTGITPELRAELHAMLTALEAYRFVDRFEVIVYAGDSPHPTFALWLANRRAAATREFLLQCGVTSSMVSISARTTDDIALRQQLAFAVAVRGRR